MKASISGKSSIRQSVFFVYRVARDLWVAMPQRLLAVVSQIAIALCLAGCGCRPEPRPGLNQNAVDGEQESRAPTFKLAPVINEDQPDFKISISIANNTPHPVEFKNITTSCGCSSAALDKYALEPEERTTLRISIGLRGRSGLQRILAYLHEKSGTTWSYIIELPVYPRAQFDQGTSRTSVPHSQPQTAVCAQAKFEVFATRSDGLPESITFQVSDPSVKVIQLPSETGKLASNLWVRSIPVRFSFIAPSKAGAYCMSLNAQYFFNGEKRDASLDIYGVVESLFEITPTYVFLGGADSDAPVSKTVVVRRTDGEPISLESVCMLCEDVDVQILPAKSTSLGLVKLSLRPQAQTRAVWGEAVLKTNHDKQPIIKIPFAAVSKKT